ncbi:NACHT, LRR and PYD domains-containing protein 12-like isoform 3-T6 [Anomaloglossus baeobatrachus]|uniref:NACHT, LRR and PYD domains-containing protein 12-like isoform X2 n=1 Tax=Anomaloglossus baeobatrachus TaxID=238106 RepID=UPI003F50B4AA
MEGTSSHGGKGSGWGIWEMSASSGDEIEEEVVSNNEKKQQFHQKLCGYEDHALRMIYEYFRDDLIFIVENLNTQLLLVELRSQNIPDVEKYNSLINDKKTLTQTLVKDIFSKRREAVIGLWVSLFALRSSHRDFPTLDAVLDELYHAGDTLVKRIVLDEIGHQLTPELKNVQECHKDYLYKKTKNLVENKPPGCNQEEESFSFCIRYLNLLIVSTKQFREHCKNELIQTGVKHEKFITETKNKLQHITVNKLFRSLHKSNNCPQMVMVSGVPGVGKTTLMQKFVYDWVTKKLYQRFSFVFLFKFREFNRLKDKVSLETLILNQYHHLDGQLGNILQDPEKLLFIFDGLDESSHNMDFRSSCLCSNYKQPEDCGQIVVSLVKKSLLNGCSVLMTSRPTRLASIDCNIFQRMVEIIGFFPEERQMYFENFFLNNKELAEKAFTYVKQNDTLYTFCYLPSYCWIICTVLSKSFQPTLSDQQVSLLPKTVTQLFAIFVANILSNHTLHQSDAQKVLRSIGWMAEYGVMNHIVIFDDQHLNSFHVNKMSKALSSFLIESEEPVCYSFLHLTVQEFLSAFAHYIDYSPVRLEESLNKAKSYSDGRGEIFLRFLCGLSDNSTRSILSSYLDGKATTASRDVISWVKDFLPNQMDKLIIMKKRKMTLSTKIKEIHLPSPFFYLFESRNKALVLDLLKSHHRIDLSGFHMSVLDCTVLAFILKNCKYIEYLNLRDCSIDTERLKGLEPGLHNIWDLRLDYNKLTETSCVQLASIIRNNQSLKTLNLSGNNLSGPHFRDLMEALSSPNCGIKELILDYNYLPEMFRIQLASVIRNNRSMKSLHVSYKNLSRPHFRDLMKVLSSPDCGIEELRLRFERQLDTFSIKFFTIIRNGRSLKKLDIFGCLLSDNKSSRVHFSDLMEVLSSPDCKIKKLELDYNELTDTSCIQLASIIRNCQSLKTLNLSGNGLYGPQFCDLVKALSSPDCGIEELRLGDNNLRDTSCVQLASIIRNSQSLKTLDLSSNRLYGPHFRDLMEAFSSPDCSIEKLELNKNSLPEASCIELASIIRNCRSLKTLDLSSNRLYGPHFSDLMKALSSPDCGIEELRLQSNLEHTALLPLTSAIRNIQSLKILDLSCNPLFSPLFGDFIEAVSSPNCKIEELILENNNLEHTCCTEFASLIRKRQNLKILNLSYNHLFGPRFNDLVEALSSSNCSIEKLDLYDKDLPEASWFQLVPIIRNNQSLKILELSGKHLTGPHFSDLVEALSSPDCGIKEFTIWNNEFTPEERYKIKTLGRCKLKYR